MAVNTATTYKKSNTHIEIQSVSSSISANAIRAKENTILAKGILCFVVSTLAVVQALCAFFGVTSIAFNVTSFVIGLIMAICGAIIQFYSMDDINHEYYEMSQIFIRNGIITFCIALCFIYIFYNN